MQLEHHDAKISIFESADCFGFLQIGSHTYMYTDVPSSAYVNRPTKIDHVSANYTELYCR